MMQTALCLNDLHVGMAWEGRPITITDDAVVAFGPEFDPQPFHIEPQAAADGPFRGLIASGWQVAALAMRELVAVRPFRASPILGLGVDELRWLKPVRPGDVLVMKAEILALTPSRSKPDRGVVLSVIKMFNLAGDLVMSFLTSKLPHPSERATNGGHESLTIHIADEVLNDLPRRLAATVWPDDSDNEDLRYRVNTVCLRDLVAYWRDGFDRRSVKKRINAFENFRIIIEGVPIHFLRKHGVGPSPMRLITTHGWPLPFGDIHKVVGPLADPAAHGGDPWDTFNVIVPSLPGYPCIAVSGERRPALGGRARRRAERRPSSGRAHCPSSRGSLLRRRPSPPA
jgi:acyl dehydratase